MVTEHRKEIEREWFAAAAERDRWRSEVRRASEFGDIRALAVARHRLRAATHRCSGIMARYRQVVGSAPPPKPVPPPPDTRKVYAAREIVGELVNLIGKANRVGLVHIAIVMNTAKDAARRVIDPRGGRRSME